MSRKRYMDKKNPTKKDWVKPYYGAQAVDTSCRCNGGCNYCRENRLYGLDTKRRRAADEQISEYFRHADEDVRGHFDDVLEE